MGAEKKTVVIPKEEAVFWLDKEGWWRNAGGRFKKKKIVDYFHSSIDRDENGYFLIHDKGGKREKVYFPYEDTALFVFDIKQQDARPEDIVLVLNTGRQIKLDPERLCAVEDNLYLTGNGERIKFAERALMKFSKFISEDKNGRLVMDTGGRRYQIPEY